MTEYQNESIQCSACVHYIDGQRVCRVFGQALDAGDEFASHPCKRYDVADVFNIGDWMTLIIEYAASKEERYFLWYLWAAVDGKKIRNREAILQFFYKDERLKVKNILQFLEN